MCLFLNLSIPLVHQLHKDCVLTEQALPADLVKRTLELKQSLLCQWKQNYSSITPSSPSNMTPAPLPFLLATPSIDCTHSLLPSDVTGEGISAAKSASTCSLISPLVSYDISNSDNSIDQPTILPAKSNFLNTCLIDNSDLTTIW
ncbi:hypothetical protein D0Y65_009650 [Glycine soja]|uniref:Uncharacterized protein n=1 Tax=Glycine soja TaxID=3848 RepID=A0A445L013_GLYSO|nr:hypothetical protein D0Y65_009650 [Glycine soja]